MPLVSIVYPYQILDVREITIENITDKASGQHLTYTVGEPELAFGSKLEIKLPTTSEKK